MSNNNSIITLASSLIIVCLPRGMFAPKCVCELDTNECRFPGRREALHWTEMDCGCELLKTRESQSNVGPSSLLQFALRVYTGSWRDTQIHLNTRLCICAESNGDLMGELILLAAIKINYSLDSTGCAKPIHVWIDLKIFVLSIGISRSFDVEVNFSQTTQSVYLIVWNQYPQDIMLNTITTWHVPRDCSKSHRKKKNNITKQLLPPTETDTGSE